MEKIKILHIIKSLGRGGAEMLLPETLKVHDQKRFEFHYIYFLPWKDQMVEPIRNAGGKITCIPASNNIKILQRYPEVIGYCKKNHIDIVHCHLPWAGFLGRVVYAKIKIPTVYTEHNMQDRYHFATKKLNKLSYNCQSLALGVSDEVTNSIRTYINPKIPVETLLNGVNTNTFQRNFESGRKTRTELGIPENAVVIGNVAVFRFQKRILEWLQVFKKIKVKNPNVFGIIVGFGPLEKEIMAEVEKLNLKRDVFFPGLKTNVQPYFNAMDIFMMSSSFEGLPIALLEAMSMECAIVATNAGGIKQVIRDQKDGLICNVEDWPRLEEMCQVLIDNPHTLKNFKKGSRERVKTTFSLTQMVTFLEEHYANLKKLN